MKPKKILKQLFQMHLRFHHQDLHEELEFLKLKIQQLDKKFDKLDKKLDQFNDKI